MDEPVGMAVNTGRGAVCCPPRVGNAGMRVENLGEVGLGLLDELLQLGYLAHLLEGKNLVLLVSIDGETGRIVTTVLETGETWVPPRISDGNRGLPQFVWCRQSSADHWSAKFGVLCAVW
jgi:hypothetical protein